MVLYKLRGYDETTDEMFYLSRIEWDVMTVEWDEDPDKAVLFYEDEVEYLQGVFRDDDVEAIATEYP